MAMVKFPSNKTQTLKNPNTLVKWKMVSWMDMVNLSWKMVHNMMDSINKVKNKDKVNLHIKLNNTISDHGKMVNKMVMVSYTMYKVIK